MLPMSEKNSNETPMRLKQCKSRVSLVLPDYVQQKRKSL